MDLLTTGVGVAIVGFIGYTLWNEVLKMKKEREGGVQVETKNVSKPGPQPNNGSGTKKEPENIFRKLEESFK